MTLKAKSKTFLFLQGPHGPFFGRFASILKSAGAKVVRVGFNIGDQFFWPRHLPFVKYNGDFTEWSQQFAQICESHQVTDLVLYGDTKPAHKEAVQYANDHNITVHVFEEGYLRPYWVTYERGGVNGNSPLNEMSLAEISEKRAARIVEQEPAPAIWGALWHHVWYGFLYHALLLFFNRGYPNFKTHRKVSVWREWGLNTRRLIIMPTQGVIRRIRTWRFLRSGRPYYVALLQLEHDASLLHHSDFDSQREYINQVITAFSEAAPPHYLLMFKAHPLDDGRAPIRQWIKDAAKAAGIKDRVVWVYGGRLGEVIDHARGVLTINSTAAQQAFWRGLPVYFFGRSVFNRPDFQAATTLEVFFSNPPKPNKEAFLEFRSYLLETSQLAGGFYTSAGRASILRKASDLVLEMQHPYSKR